MWILLCVVGAGAPGNGTDEHWTNARSRSTSHGSCRQLRVTGTGIFGIDLRRSSCKYSASLGIPESSITQGVLPALLTFGSLTHAWNGPCEVPRRAAALVADTGRHILDRHFNPAANRRLDPGPYPGGVASCLRLNGFLTIVVGFSAPPTLTAGCEVRAGPLGIWFCLTCHRSDKVYRQAIGGGSHTMVRTGLTELFSVGGLLR